MASEIRSHINYRLHNLNAANKVNPAEGTTMNFTSRPCKFCNQNRLECLKKYPQTDKLNTPKLLVQCYDWEEEMPVIS